jgi:hypothetical protein
MKTRIGLISLFLMVFVGGCGSTKYVQLKPDPTLLQDCPRTEVVLLVNGDLALAFRARDQDLSRCNADKAALRAFYGTED